MGPLVSPVHDRIADKLLERNKWIVWGPRLQRAGSQVDSSSQVGPQLVIQPSDKLRERGGDPVFIDDGPIERVTMDPEKLHERARYEVDGTLREDQESEQRRRWNVGARDHSQGGKSLFKGPFVLLEDIDGKGCWEILVLEQGA